MRIPKPPHWRDPRYPQLLIVGSYTIAARSVFNSPRTHLTALLCVLTTVSLDLFWGKFKFGKVIFPLSAVLVGASTSLLLYANEPWLIVFGAALAVTSKAFLRVNGRHIFNPSCFGAVAMLYLAPYSASGMPMQFGGYLWPTIIFWGLGMLILVYARQLVLAGAWVGGYLVFGTLRHFLLGVPWLVATGQILSPVFALLTCHLMSDPVTTPSTTKYRIQFGLIVALVDVLLRSAQVPNSTLHAVFVACALNPFFFALESREASTHAAVALRAPAG